MLINSSVYLGLLILATIGNISFISKFFNQSWKISLFTLANIYILVLYLFALIKKLDFGVYLILIIGITLFINFINKYKEKKEKKINLIEFLWLFPFIIFIRAVPKDYRFTMFDEFNSWAVNIKWLVAERALGDINSATRFISEGFNQSYPPAQQLFQFLIINRMRWSEANVLVAQIIFLCICLLALNATFNIKSFKISFGAYLASILLFYIFGLTFNNILADNLLAVHFATCVAYTVKTKLNKRALFLIGIYTSTLSLIKPISFIFTILPITIIILRYNIKSNCKILKINYIFHKKKKIIYRLSYLIIPPTITILSWNLHVKIIGINTSVKFPNFTDNKTFSKSIEILRVYRKTFFGPLYGDDNLAGTSAAVPKIAQILHLSLFNILVVLFLLQVSLMFIKPINGRSDLRIITAAIALFAIFYQFILIYLYISFFGEVAALTRYTIPILYGWCVLIMYLFIEKLYVHPRKNIIFSLILVIVIINIPNQLKFDSVKITSNPTKLAKRIEVEKMVKLVQHIVEKESNVYYLYQGSDNYEKFIFSYLMLPNKTNDHCPSIGIPYNSQDRWTCSVRLENVLYGYNYLAIGRADKFFWEKNAIYLDKNSNPVIKGIFKISFRQQKILLTEIFG